MKTNHSIAARITLIALTTLLVLVGCNIAARRAEKAMDLSTRMEDKFLEVAKQALVNPSKEDLESLEKAKLNFRAGRARLRAEATGDALVTRCAEHMDELDRGIDGMEGATNVSHSRRFHDGQPALEVAGALTDPGPSLL